jgi:hypothetical protein
MADNCLLLHAPRPPIDPSIETAAQLTPSRGACHGLMGVA